MKYLRTFKNHLFNSSITKEIATIVVSQTKHKGPRNLNVQLTGFRNVPLLC